MQMQTENHSRKEAPKRKRNVNPLTKAQQELAEKYLPQAFKYAQEEEKKLGGSNDYYAYALDINAVAEELLVIAASKFNPNHEKANFGAYLRTCIRNGLIREYRNCERYMRGNRDPWILRELHEDSQTNAQAKLLVSEKEIALEEICRKLDEECQLKAKAKDVLLTISHEESLSAMARRYSMPQHTLRYEQKKLISAINQNKELADSIRFALTETGEMEKATNCGLIAKKTYEK